MAFVIHLLSHLLQGAPPWVGGVACMVYGFGLRYRALRCMLRRRLQGWQRGMCAVLSRRCDAW